MRQRGTRHAGREYALRLLYGNDILQKAGIDQPLTSIANWWDEEGLLSVMPEAETFARQIYSVYKKEQERIDSLISAHAKNWRLERMSPVDRNILRMSVCEVMGEFNTPRQVLINESVELAKTYGDEHSARFVNGILDTLIKDIQAKSLPETV